MSRKWYSGSIALSALTSVVTTKTGKDGKPVKGLFIPLDKNHITEYKNDNGSKLELHVRVGMMEEADERKQIAMITHTVNGETYKAASEDEKAGFKKLPILGNLFDWSNQGSTEPAVQEVPEEEDLPF
ncbi:MAG: hypothetical protein GY853_16840 [PVC group bacterium]|nr:hypothetical protein [PVC group bacterium]